MTRSAPSGADVALIAALADRGLDVSPYQLERWRTAGLVPRNHRRALGRGKGSTSELDAAAVDQAAALAGRARQGRAMPGCHIIERFAAGQRLEETRVRAAFHAFLDRISRKLAVDAGSDDRGWQARYDAARKISRNATYVSWQGLIDAANETPERPALSPAEERAGARAMFRVLADATETTAEELLQAFGTFGKVAGHDVEQLITAHREAELAGTDDWDTLANALSLPRYRQILNATSIETLQRSATAVYTAMALQGMITLMGMWPVLASRTGAIEHCPIAPPRSRTRSCQCHDGRPYVAAVGYLPRGHEPSKHRASPGHEYARRTDASRNASQRRGIQCTPARTSTSTYSGCISHRTVNTSAATPGCGVPRRRAR